MSLELQGRYKILNDTLLREKANRESDPRHVFYIAILISRTYEEYLKRVGNLKVEPSTYKSKPVTASMEIRYCRRHRWIIDD